ncbi:MAG: DSD1 family PLP-dependent enzyme [Gammaproteobacteria bacterium]|nr:DSD1 family PLP-dependent enzyme [Gammaproteobacteria bacterium]
MQRPPAEIGMPLSEVDTPALIVDLDAFEHNLERMAEKVRRHGVRIRPHAKTHKCAVIGQRQMALGAVGLCCQKVSEAEALVDAGIPDVLVSNEVVGERKLRRLAALARRARVGVCVDDARNVRDLGEAAGAAGAELGVLVEIDVGGNRCGVTPGAAAVELAQRVAATPGLRFDGLQAYQGSAQHKRSYEERREAIDIAIGHSRDTVSALRAVGLECRTVGGAGTGTLDFEAGSGVYNELQAGSYIFMDADYGRNLDQAGNFVSEWRHSLFVLVTVMSTPDPDRVVVDAGHKAISGDSGPPDVHAAQARYERPSDEHGVIRYDRANQAPTLGDKIRLIPGHCDPTVNLHEWYVGIRDERVEALWPIVARGALF